MSTELLQHGHLEELSLIERILIGDATWRLLGAVSFIVTTPLFVFLVSLVVLQTRFDPRWEVVLFWVLFGVFPLTSLFLLRAPISR